MGSKIEAAFCHQGPHRVCDTVCHHNGEVFCVPQIYHRFSVFIFCVCTHQFTARTVKSRSLLTLVFSLISVLELPKRNQTMIENQGVFRLCSSANQEAMLTFQILKFNSSTATRLLFQVVFYYFFFS